MSRSGYSDDGEDQWAFIRWRGAVASAIRGKRGQAFFVELLAALDAMPEKRLVANVLVDGPSGEVCAMGAVAVARGVDMAGVVPDDPYDDYGDSSREAGKRLGIPYTLACEIAYMNDEAFGPTPEKRWQEMRAWVARQIQQPAKAQP